MLAGRVRLYSLWSSAIRRGESDMGERQADDAIQTKLPTGTKLVRVLEGHRHWVRSVALDGRGELLASGSDDKTVRLWDAHTGKLLHTLMGHRWAVNCVALDGR